MVPLSKRQTVVVATGQKLEHNTEVVQKLPMTHDPGTPDAMIVGKGFATINQVGGLMIDGPGGSVEFHPMSSFDKVTFSLEKVSLVTVG